jgi:hypothetical protein
VGQQIAFILLIVLCVMIFSQILMLAKNEKKRYDRLVLDIKKIKEKIGIN